MDTRKFIACLLDEAERLNSVAPIEPEFTIKMTAATVITSLARALINARKAGAV